MRFISYLLNNTVVIGTICQFLLATFAMISLIFTAYNFGYNNKIERGNSLYELIRYCKKINTIINSDLDYYIIKRELFEVVVKILNNIKPLPDSGGEIKDTLAYYSDNDESLSPSPIYLLPEAKEAYTLFNDLYKNNRNIIYNFRTDQNQLTNFDDYILSAEICMKTKFSERKNVRTRLRDYLDSLKGYREVCTKIVQDKKDLNYLVELREIIFDKIDPIITSEERIQQNLNTYIENLMAGNKEKIDNEKKKIMTAYDSLENVAKRKKLE